MTEVSAPTSLDAVLNLSTKVLTLLAKYSHASRYAKGSAEKLISETAKLKSAVEDAQKQVDRPGGTSVAESSKLLAALHESRSRLEEVEEALNPGEKRSILRRMGMRSLKWPIKDGSVEDTRQGLAKCTAMLSEYTHAGKPVPLKAGQSTALDENEASEDSQFDTEAEDSGASCSSGTPAGHPGPSTQSRTQIATANPVAWKLCRKCRGIVAKEHGSVRIAIRDLHLGSTCLCCRLVHVLLLRVSRQDNLATSDVRIDKNEAIMLVYLLRDCSPSRGCHMISAASCQRCERHIGTIYAQPGTMLAIVASTGNTSTQGQNKITRKELKTILARCENHVDCQYPTKPLRHSSTLFLIHVKEMRLVNFAPVGNACFAALSYVWGSVNMFKLTKTNLETLKQPQALQLSSLPQVVRDSIKVLRMARIDYLWVDALCIIQDDPETKLRQIIDMDLIYQNAVFTIVAATGRSADDGLPGVSFPFPERLAGTASGAHLSLLKPTQEDIFWIRKMSHYENRGWTLQESTLSRMALHFMSHGLHVVCQNESASGKAGWWINPMYDLKYHISSGLLRRPPLVFTDQRQSEDSSQLSDQTMTLESCADRERHPLTSIIHQGLGGNIVESCTVLCRGRRYSNDTTKAWQGGLFAYSRLVSEYTGRCLSYDSDKTNAFLGISGALTQICGGEFLYGLPEAIFHLALLWHPSTAYGYRRADAPSWSWVGWTGSVDYFQSSSDPIPMVASFVIVQESGNRLISPIHRGYTYRHARLNYTSLSMGLYADLEIILDKDKMAAQEPYRSDAVDLHMLQTDASAALSPLLIFNAFVVRADVFVLKDSNTKAPSSTSGSGVTTLFEIFKDTRESASTKLYYNDSSCGTLYGAPIDANWFQTSEGPVAQVEFAILATCGGQTLRERLDVPQEPEQVIMLLIEWSCEVAVRRGLGVVDRQVFRSLDPVQKLVTLE